MARFSDYVIEGTGRFIKAEQLQQGDVIFELGKVTGIQPALEGPMFRVYFNPELTKYTVCGPDDRIPVFFVGSEPYLRGTGL